MFGRQTEIAIAAMTRLAEAYGDGCRLSSAGIASDRNLQRPFVAKVLTSLSQAGLITGSPGPGGGYTLSRPPEEIQLFDVVRVFEREEDLEGLRCLGWITEAGAKSDRARGYYNTIRSSLRSLLHDTTLADYCACQLVANGNGVHR